MLMRERRVIVTLATSGSRGWASGLLFFLAYLVQLYPNRNEWISLVIFPEMAFKMEVYWSSIKEAARCYWTTMRKLLAITLLMRPSFRVLVSRKLSHLTSESIYSHSVLFLCQVNCITSHYVYRPEPEAEDTPVDCSEACAIPPPNVSGESEVDKKTN